MTEDKFFKSGQAAKRLGVHPNTIRSWADTFADFMSDRATGPRRKYTSDDLRIMATIAQHRDQGLNNDQIRRVLENGQIVESVPDPPTIILDPVTAPERQEITAHIGMLERQLARVISERDEARLAGAEMAEKLNTRIRELERELGEARGALRERKSTDFWLAMVAAVAVVTAVAVYLLAVGL